MSPMSRGGGGGIFNYMETSCFRVFMLLTTQKRMFPCIFSPKCCNGNSPLFVFATDDIAVDWVNNKLYWADGTYQRVEVLDLDSGNRATVLTIGGGTSLSGIAVDPTTR